MRNPVHAILSCALATLGACGGDSVESTSYDGVLTVDPWDIEHDASRVFPDAGAELIDASQPDERDAAPPDAAPPDAALPDGRAPDARPSNTPWAEHVYVGDGPSYGVSLRASNLQQAPSGDQVFARWFISVENNGTDYLCSALVYADFLDADGNTLAKFTATTSSPIYRSGTLDLHCIPPGESAPGSSNGFFPSAIDLDQVDRIEYRLGGSLGSGLTPVIGPSVTNIIIDPAFGRRIASGRITNGPDSVQYPSISIYPIDARSMPLNKVTDTGPSYLGAFGTWDFQTLQSEVPIDAYIQVVDFIR